MNNPPAFPSSNEVTLNDWVSSGHSGMSLRDYFAARAMQALLRQYPDHLMNSPASEVASDAYSMADAMMKVREE